MAISTQIPESWSLPLFWATVDGSMAGNVTETQPALIVGQMFTAGPSIGTATPNVPVAVGSPALGQALFGEGSMLDRMIGAWFQVNSNQLLFVLPVVEPAAGIAATGTIVIGGAPTAAGTLVTYIAGQAISIPVATSDTPTTIGAALAAAINANLELPVTAVNTSGSVALTCRWKGLTGNDIQIINNYYGVVNGEVLPTGVTSTITPMSGGTSQPSFATAISNIQMFRYLYVAMPFTDATSMSVWNTEYGFGAAGRWNYSRQQRGFICNAYRDTYANLITWGQGVNSPVMSTLAIETVAQSPVWEWAAQYAGLAALGFSDDPARPLQTLEFQQLLPAQLPSRFIQAQLNNLTNGGFAVQAVAPDGNPMIMREQTQYQKNSFGQSDTAFGLLTVLATLDALLTRMSAAITSKYPRVKLIPDGTRIGPGQAAVTPGDIKAELISEFLAAEFDGLVANVKAFVANLLVEIDNNNPNRVNVLWPPQLAGQLRIFAALAQFRLLYPPVALT